MTFVKTILLAAAALAVAAPVHAATTLDFDDLAQEGTGRSYIDPASFDYRGYRFSSEYSEGPHFLVWNKSNLNNADFGGGALAHNWDKFPMSVSKVDGGAFDLASLDIADIANKGVQTLSQFTFRYADGREEYALFNTDDMAGLQTFQINRSGLVSFSYALPAGQWVQIDNLILADAVSAVPEPATWAMMILGFGGVGSMLRRSRRARAAVFA